MAITKDTVSSGEATSASLTIPHVATGANLLMIVGTCTRAQVVTDVTWNGVSLTKLDEIAVGSQLRMSFWYMVGPATGSHDVVVSVGASNRLTAAVITYEGVDPTTPLGTLGKNSGTSTSGSASVSSASGELVFGVLGVTETGEPVTPDGSETEEFEITNTGNPNLAMTCQGASEPGAATVTIDPSFNAATQFGIIAVPLKPFAGGPSSIPHYYQHLIGQGA